MHWCMSAARRQRIQRQKPSEFTRQKKSPTSNLLKDLIHSVISVAEYMDSRRNEDPARRKAVQTVERRITSPEPTYLSPTDLEHKICQRQHCQNESPKKGTRSAEIKLHGRLMKFQLDPGASLIPRLHVSAGTLNHTIAALRMWNCTAVKTLRKFIGTLCDKDSG